MSEKRVVFNWQLFLGLVLIITGGLFLADQFLSLNLMGFFWPLLIVIFGASFLLGMLMAGKRGAGLAIPGTIITVTGLLLFIQNTFDLWVTWTYAWALLISATGLGLLIMNSYFNRLGLRRVAGLIIGVGLTLFVVFGVLFEVILGVSGTNLQSGVFLGGGLLLLGLFVIFSRPLFARRRPKPAAEPVKPEVIIDADMGEVEEGPTSAAAGHDLLPGDAEFTGVSFEGIGKVMITQGEQPALSVEVSEDLLENISVKVEGEMLSIMFDAGIDGWDALKSLQGQAPIRYDLTVRELSEVRLAGAGDLRSGHLEGDSLKIDHQGAGRINLADLHYESLVVELGGLGEIVLSGEIPTQVVNLDGVGGYQAKDLKSQTAEVLVTGAGEAQVWVEEKLKAQVSGIGAIRYRGTPAVEESSSEMGRIEPI